MPKNLIISTVLFIFVLVASVFVLGGDNPNFLNFKKENNQTETEMSQNTILYYGEGCPHCEIVEDFIKKNNIKQKVNFPEKEVYYNRENSKELEGKAKDCGIDTLSIGVPLLWHKGQCFMGDQEIINFLEAYNNEN